MSIKNSNITSDYIEWGAAVNLVHRLYRDSDYRMSLLVGCGIFFGLRISDTFRLTWLMFLEGNSFEIIEKKTQKRREVRINANFQKHSEELKKRKYLEKANRKWYEYWVPQNPLLWDKTKIVFADISSTPRFAIDKNGSIVNGNCYWIVAEKDEDKDILYLIAAIANSKLMEKYHDLCFNNKLYSGKRRYLSQYVEKYPIPNINHPSSQKIISLVKEITESVSLSPNDISTYSAKIEKLVFDAFS